MLPEAQRFQFEKLSIAYYEAGSGFPLLLLHGAGPGSSTRGNWLPVWDRLAAHFHVYAMDLIGFGRSDRKPREPYFDIDMWVGQCEQMLSLMAGTNVGVIGHSVSGALTLRLAARTARISGALVTGSCGRAFTLTNEWKKLDSYPRTRAELRETAGTLFHDKALITDSYLEDRERTLFAPGYEAYYSSMFAGNHAQECVVPDDLLAAIRCPVTIMQGRNDAIVPPEAAISLWQALPRSELILLNECSHSVAAEKPEQFLAAVQWRFGNRA